MNRAPFTMQERIDARAIGRDGVAPDDEEARQIRENRYRYNYLFNADGAYSLLEHHLDHEHAAALANLFRVLQTGNQESIEAAARALYERIDATALPIAKKLSDDARAPLPPPPSSIPAFLQPQAG